MVSKILLAQSAHASMHTPLMWNTETAKHLYQLGRKLNQKFLEGSERELTSAVFRRAVRAMLAEGRHQLLPRSLVVPLPCRFGQSESVGNKAHSRLSDRRILPEPALATFTSLQVKLKVTPFFAAQGVSLYQGTQLLKSLVVVRFSRSFH